MSQKYKVYFANRPVIFTNDRPAACDVGKQCEVLDSKGKMDVVLIENAVAKGMKSIYIFSENSDKAWDRFSEQFEFVQAAGGLVINAEGKMLFIFRHGKWDLPKGKVEEDEAIDDGALREVEEECSISDLNLQELLCTTWHTYIQKGEPMLKSTVWYIMNYTGTKSPKPQAEEGITSAEWLSWNELGKVRANTYPSVMDVVEAYEAKLKSNTGA